MVRVTGRPMAPVAAAVEVAPEGEEDWEAVMAAATDVERRLLTQCGVVAEGQAFPFWPAAGGGGSFHMTLVHWFFFGFPFRFGFFSAT